VLAVLAAAVVAAVVHLLFDAAGADYVVAPNGQEPTTVGAPMAAGVAALVTALGAGVAALLARTTRRPSRWFLIAAVVVLALMAVNPVLAADQVLTVVALEVMHLAVAAVALALLLPPLRARDRA
jgi:ABC-type Fe3+ transport system permease subunit